jgi:hypothetical protein
LVFLDFATIARSVNDLQCELAINVKTARVLDLAGLVLQADEIAE